MVIRTGHPSRATAILPGITEPSFLPVNNAAFWNCIGLPDFGTVLCRTSSNPTTYAILSTSGTHNELTFKCHRHDGHCLSVGVVTNHYVKFDGTSCIVQSNDMRIQGCQVYLVSIRSNTAVYHIATELRKYIGRQVTCVDPVNVSISTVDRYNAVKRRRHVNGSVHDHALTILALKLTKRDLPLWHQVFYIAPVDLSCCAITSALIVFTIVQPV